MTHYITPSLYTLLSIPSTADNPNALALAVSELKKNVKRHPGVTIEEFNVQGKPSFLAYFGSKRPKRFTVLLNGHVDVVPATADQFVPKVKKGRLYARGALDMKAASYIMTEVFCEVAPKLTQPVGLQIVSDEEVGGIHGTAAQLSAGVYADLAVFGECTPSAGICTESRGICWVRLTFTGKAAHGAYPWRGDNAVVQASNCIQNVLKHYPVPDSEAWTTTANIATIQTPNKTANKVPGQATMEVDIRFVPEDRTFTSRARVQALFRRLAPGAEVEILMLEPGTYADPSDPLITKLATAVSNAYARPATFIRKYGGFDGRYYHAKGMPALSLGLQGEGLHSAEEYAELESLNRYWEALRLFLYRSNHP
ncbi:MAG TPA: M20/M25/M40 family metallo-hydrolase [Candidatus Saccharimonadales bacterium]|nr:M20/M25/M40 family metallo-hydrolase [Candidatus Saccharimonadales bacterium]